MLCHPSTIHGLLQSIRAHFPTAGTLSPSADAEGIEPMVTREDE